MAWGLQGLGVGSRAAPGAHSRQDGRHPEQILRRFDDFGFHNTRQQTRCHMLLAVCWRAEAQQAGALKVKKSASDNSSAYLSGLACWFAGGVAVAACLSASVALGPQHGGRTWPVARSAEKKQCVYLNSARLLVVVDDICVLATVVQ